MIKFTPKNLEKLEEIVLNSNYVLRYEKGNFKSGWCLLEAKKIVILNKFLQVEDRINTLVDLIPQLQIDFDKLTRENQILFEQVIEKTNPNILI